METTPEEQYYSQTEILDEFQTLIGKRICYRTLLTLIAKGLPYTQVGKRKLFRRSTILRWLEGQETTNRAVSRFRKGA